MRHGSAGLHQPAADPEDGEVYPIRSLNPTTHRAWPCVDQPDVKPAWTFHVIAPQEWVVFSNGVARLALRPPLTEDAPRSPTTPLLSSYITAVAAPGGHR